MSYVKCNHVWIQATELLCTDGRYQRGVFCSILERWWRMDRIWYYFAVFDFREMNRDIEAGYGRKCFPNELSDTWLFFELYLTRNPRGLLPLVLVARVFLFHLLTIKLHRQYSFLFVCCFVLLPMIRDAEVNLSKKVLSRQATRHLAELFRKMYFWINFGRSLTATFENTSFQMRLVQYLPRISNIYFFDTPRSMLWDVEQI